MLIKYTDKMRWTRSEVIIQKKLKCWTAPPDRVNLNRPTNASITVFSLTGFVLIVKLYKSQYKKSAPYNIYKIYIYIGNLICHFVNEDLQFSLRN